MRQFIAAAFPDGEGRVSLSEADAHYFSQVLRFSPGARVDVRLPDGTLAPMTLNGRGKAAYLEAAGGVPAERAAGTQTAFYLFQFLPKAAKMDAIVRQAAETGVSAVVPVLGAYSPPQDSAGRAERWRRIIREARQQSGSPVDTAVLSPLPPEEALSWWRQEKAGKPAFQALLSETAADCGTGAFYSRLRGAAELPICAAVAVGSEGGIADGERQLFFAEGFAPVHFQTNVLRADTAALYGMAALQTALTEGDYGDTAAPASRRSR
ncbi:RsmE family RNA methyltransferase [Treponema endosymbiont of Eucomonympha sp.]|uniref:RsmE family RNA methyltransferase n=1 Tax=Treponema endosymbiont of Eucomonympha sp. TaxID=1580831 RepID=UPI0007860C09|nr:RsmE family RNA methyltransferase [Treponema endosymbiont of Eucomonympha sp.]